MRTDRITTGRVALWTALAGLAAGVAFGGGMASATPAACTALIDPVHSEVNPVIGVGLLTASQSEADSAPRYGFTQDHGTPFTASKSAATGMAGVHRLYRASSGDWMWTTNLTEVASAVAKYGYVDHGVAFHAATDAGAGCVPVLRFVRGSVHRFGVATDHDALVAGGWRQEGTAFYGGVIPVTPPPPASQPFSIAVLPDTQNWTSEQGDTRFANATAYLAAQRTSLNLQQVLQTGDLVNWGWLDPSQYTVASNALQTLQTAGVPYLLTVGNHDTRAVGWNGVAGSRAYGGAAYAKNPECPERLGAAQCDTTLLIRHSEEFNSTFTAAREQDVGGQFEPGKVDNEYSTFTAGGKKWLTLSLEFCPRVAAVDWAKSVVAAHSDYNVIVETHYYLDKNGVIAADNQGYGASTPQYLYDNLVKVYPNIKLVFSGHVDHSNAYREDTGINGNTIVSMMLADLNENRSNAMRLVTIDPATGTVSSRIYAPNLSQSYPQYDHTSTLSLVG